MIIQIKNGLDSVLCFCVFGSTKRCVKITLFHFAFMKELQKVSTKEEYITRTLK